MRVPRDLQELILKVEQVDGGAARASLGRPPTVTDIARRLEVTDEQVLEAMSASQGHHAVSLDRPANVEGEEA